MRLGLFGLPGAGKGTQAELLSKRFSLCHISTGDLFRKLQSGSSKLALEIRDILASGQLVSDEMVTRLAFERLGQEDCLKGFILDGYPRTLSQAEDLEASEFALDALINIDIDRAIIIKRLSERRVCGHCKLVFSLASLEHSDRCPHDGSILEERPDDKIEAITTRLALFEANFLPVMKFFDSRQRLHHVDGTGSVEQVSARMVELIGKIYA